jgi:hypothetical protein
MPERSSSSRGSVRFMQPSSGPWGRGLYLDPDDVRRPGVRPRAPGRGPSGSVQSLDGDVPKGPRPGTVPHRPTPAIPGILQPWRR